MRAAEFERSSFCITACEHFKACLPSATQRKREKESWREEKEVLGRGVNPCGLESQNVEYWGGATKLKRVSGSMAVRERMKGFIFIFYLLCFLF